MAVKGKHTVQSNRNELWKIPPLQKKKQKNKAEVIWFSLRRKNKDFFSHTSKEKFNFICCCNNQMIPTCSFLNWEWLHFKVNACLKKTKKPLFLFFLSMLLYMPSCAVLFFVIYTVCPLSRCGWLSFFNI